VDTIAVIEIPDDEDGLLMRAMEMPVKRRIDGRKRSSRGLRSWRGLSKGWGRVWCVYEAMGKL
jgi:hypothetical protein